MLVLVLAIAGFSRGSWRCGRPRTDSATARVLGVALVTIYVFEIVYAAARPPGQRAGPDAERTGSRTTRPPTSSTRSSSARGSRSSRSSPTAASAISLLERFGRWPAIIIVGLLFGLAHGLDRLPAGDRAFGCVLAWIRSRTDSVYPGMVLHAPFNLIALVAAVTL